MLLRTLAGSRAGQIEDYAYLVGCRALARGLAERLDAPPRDWVLAPQTACDLAPGPDMTGVVAAGKGKQKKRSGR